MLDSVNSFVRKLAHNDAATRSAAFNALCNFLKSKSSKNLALLEAEKLWKGLYYSMWYCDKPIPQQNLAGNLGKLFSEVIPDQHLKIFHEAFWVIMDKEWPSLDRWRIDKFYMLIRRIVRHNFFRLEISQWNDKMLEDFLDVLRKYVFANEKWIPKALAYHICDIYLDEIEYVVFKEFRDYSEEDEGDDEQDESDSDENDDSDSEDEEGDASKQTHQKNEDSKTSSLPEKNGDEEQGAEKDESEIASKKKQLISLIPLKKLLSIFEETLTKSNYKPLRQKCEDEVLNDERLQEWGFVDSHSSDESSSSDSEEWTGF